MTVRKKILPLYLMNHMPTLKTLLTALFAILPCILSGQNRGIHMLCRTDGLCGESVGDIITDHSGCTWMITSGGISMFNGQRISNFRIHDKNRRPVKITGICEFGRGNIYVATHDGLYVQEECSGSFSRVMPEIERLGTLRSIGDSLLFISSYKGMHIYDGKHIKTVSIGESKAGLDKLVRCFQPDSRGSGVWLNNRYELFHYSLKTGKLQRKGLASLLPKDAALGQFVVTDDTLAYVGTKNHGLFVFDIKNRRLDRVAGIGNVISTVSLSKDNILCVSTDGQGAWQIEPATGKVICHFGTSETEERRLRTDAIYNYYRDANGVDWFGMARYGLAYTYHCHPLFQTYKYGSFTTAGENIRSFLINGQHRILGTMHGFYFIDEHTGTVRKFASEEIGGNIVTCITRWQDEYYIGTYDAGLKVFNPHTLTVRQQQTSPLLSASTIGCLVAAPDGSLWVGSSEGLFVLDKSGKYKRYTEQNSHISGGLISSVVFTPEGNAWISGTDGLSTYIPHLEAFEDEGFPKDFFNHYGHLKIHPGRDSIMFFYSNPYIFYSDLSMKNYGEISLPEGLLEERCNAFADDMTGHLWISTENGLFYLDYKKGEVRHFGPGEGISGQFVNCLSISTDSTLWAGTSDGLVSMHPEAMRKWENDGHYRVHLYDIRINGEMQPINTEYRLNEQRELYINWNFTSDRVQLTPLLLDYAMPFSRLYEYSVDGDSTWTLVKAKEDIVIERLLLGRHELTVRVPGAAGTSVTYAVYVVPSWLAVFETVLLVAFAVLLFLWWRFRKNTKVLLNERDEIEDTLIEMEQEQQREETIKYQRVKLDDKESVDIVARMREYIEKERVYTNTELKMSDLAEVLGISPSKLSQIFSQYVGENYYEFINGYRLAEFKRLVSEGEYRRYTLTALSEKCGFKRANFFSTFRKVEGMTPAEYMKKMNLK